MFMCALVEKKARLPVIFMLFGIFVSVFASEVNGLLSQLLGMDMYSFTTVVTPITEEILKAMPILLYAIIISDKSELLFTASMATSSTSRYSPVTEKIPREKDTVPKKSKG